MVRRAVERKFCWWCCVRLPWRASCTRSRTRSEQVNASCEKVFAAKNKSASSESRWNMNIEINTSSECAQSRVMKFTRAASASSFLFAPKPSAAHYFYIMCIGMDGQTEWEREKRLALCVCLIWPVIKERMDHLVGPRGTGVSFVPPIAPPRAGISFLFHL